MATKHISSKRKSSTLSKSSTGLKAARPAARKAVASVKATARKAVAAVRGGRKAPLASKSKTSSSRSFARAAR